MKSGRGNLCSQPVLHPSIGRDLRESLSIRPLIIPSQTSIADWGGRVRNSILLNYSPHYNLSDLLRAPADVIRRRLSYFTPGAVAVGHPDCSRPVRLSRGDIFSFVADHHGFFGSQLPGFQNEFNQVRFIIELPVQFCAVNSYKPLCQLKMLDDSSAKTLGFVVTTYSLKSFSRNAESSSGIPG